MKSLVLFFLVFTLAIGVVSAGGSACNEPGFPACWENNDYPPSHSKIFYAIQDDGISDGINNGYAVGRLFATIGYEGDDLYTVDNLRNWDDLWCDEFGSCDSSSGTLSLIGFSENPGELLLATKGQTFDQCIAFVVWDETGGEWSYVGHGWTTQGGCPSWNVVECYDDSDCSNNEICDKSGNWQSWSCKSENSAPTVSSLSPPTASIITTDLVNFSADFTDDIGLDGSEVHIMDKSGQEIFQNIDSLSGTSDSSTIQMSFENEPDGDYFWFYKVFDTSGLSTESPTIFFTLDRTGNPPKKFPIEATIGIIIGIVLLISITLFLLLRRK